MTAQLDQIHFEVEQARRDFEADKLTRAERAQQERRRFFVQMVVTSIAGVTAAAALILHLLGKA